MPAACAVVGGIPPATATATATSSTPVGSAVARNRHRWRWHLRRPDNCTDVTACNFDEPGNGLPALDECGVCGGCRHPLRETATAMATSSTLRCLRWHGRRGWRRTSATTSTTAPTHRLQLCRSDTTALPVLDECGVCGGSGIPAGDCDCDRQPDRRLWRLRRNGHSSR